MSRALLYELLYLYFTDAARAQRSRTDYNKLKPAIHALDTAYTEDTSVAQLAALCGLSETHFRRLFVKLLGTTPTEYRIHKRILRAKDLLMSGQYTVAETARAAGFSDASYFSRVFRAHTGTSPRSFTEV